jgi:hypothetical protein
MPYRNHKWQALAKQDAEPARSCRSTAQIDHPNQFILRIEPSAAVPLVSRKTGMRMIASPLRAGGIFQLSKLDRIFRNLTDVLPRDSGKTAKL